jgi:hypothetical protein
MVMQGGFGKYIFRPGCHFSLRTSLSEAMLKRGEPIGLVCGLSEAGASNLVGVCLQAFELSAFV